MSMTDGMTSNALAWAQRTPIQHRNRAIYRAKQRARLRGKVLTAEALAARFPGRAS